MVLPAEPETVDCFSHVPCLVKIEAPAIFSFEDLQLFTTPDYALITRGTKVTTQGAVVVLAAKPGRYRLSAASNFGTREISVKVKQGVRCHPHPRSAAVATVECIKDLGCVLNFDAGPVSFNLRCRGEKGNLRIPADGLFFTAEFPGENLPPFRAPLAMEDVRAARIFSLKEEVPLSVSAACTPEVTVGGSGKLKISVKQNLAGGVPLKGAWRLLPPPDALLFSGAVSGVKTFVPGETEITANFFAIVPGEIFLPGVEIELMPNGEMLRLENGPRTFAVTVVHR